MTAGHIRNADRRITVRFGNAVLDAGFTTIPNLVLEHYAALGITTDEIMFTIHVWQYWWTAEQPYPSLNTIAGKMGKSWRTVHRYAKSLEAKGFLIITNRYGDDQRQMTNAYDFEPLIEAVVRSGGTAAVPPPIDNNPSDSGDRGALPDPADPGVTGVTDEENGLTKTPMERDFSKSPPTRPRISAEDRRFVGQYLSDFCRELNDQSPVQSAVTRAINLWRQAGVDRDHFVSALYEAREVTRRYSGSIRAGSPGRRHMMPYFFTVLEEALDRDQHAQRSGS